MKVIIAGGRDYTDKQRMKRMLKHFITTGIMPRTAELVCGMAKGADLLARELFLANGLKVHERPADWRDMSEPCRVGTNQYGKYNKLAGMKRNHAMGDEAEILIAFWNGSKGTKDMIDYMRKLGKTVTIVNYSTGSESHSKSTITRTGNKLP